MTIPIIVVDLDGTLCNSAHREHLARAGDWDAFHGALLDDEPWPDVKKLLESLFNDFIMVALTGRNQKYQMMTLKWLQRNECVLFDELLMRPDDCYLSDTEIKPQLLDEFLERNGKSHSDVLFILEDRDKMVETWRNLGHTCYQVRAGGY